MPNQFSFGDRVRVIENKQNAVMGLVGVIISVPKGSSDYYGVAGTHPKYKYPLTEVVAEDGLVAESPMPDPLTSLVGHPRFYQLTEAENKLHTAKNHDYAQGGRPMGNFERVASILAAYPKLELHHPAVVALVYLLKQLDAAFWLLNEGHVSKTGEGVAERLRDVSIYAKLATILVEEHTSHAIHQAK